MDDDDLLRDLQRQGEIDGTGARFGPPPEGFGKELSSEEIYNLILQRRLGKRGDCDGLETGTKTTT